MFKKIVVLSMLLVFVLSLSTLPSFAANGTITTQKTPFDRALKSGKPVIVKLGADWCPACREMKPNLEAAAKELGDKAVVLDLDIDKYRNLASVYKINLITFLNLIHFY